MENVESRLSRLGGVALCLVLAAGCDRGATPVPSTSSPNTSHGGSVAPAGTLDAALENDGFLMDNVKIVPSPDNKGIYILMAHGVWFVEGAQAKKVVESPATR